MARGASPSRYVIGGDGRLEAPAVQQEFEELWREVDHVADIASSGVPGQPGPAGPQGPPGTTGAPGAPGPAGVPYVHMQSPLAAVWVIDHPLGKYPSVTVVDSGNNVLEADVRYLNPDQLTITFAAPTSGKAYLN